MMNCPNKGCYKTQEPLLDVELNQVFCSECQKEITNVTSFAKVQMKNLRQTRTNSKKKETYSVKCNRCDKESKPVLSDTDTLMCRECKQPLQNISIPFANLLKQVLKKDQE